MRDTERRGFRKAEAFQPQVREGLFPSCEIRVKCSFNFLRKSDHENSGN
jgi:hypothetical protein